MRAFRPERKRGCVVEVLKAFANGSGAAGMALGYSVSRKRLAELSFRSSVGRKRVAGMAFRPSAS